MAAKKFAKGDALEDMIKDIEKHVGTVLHKGAYVDTIICGKQYPAGESMCAFCDGTREAHCPTCVTSVWDDAWGTCPTCDGEMDIHCPQKLIRWCHE
ncbi:hypothetical protein [Frankia sp. Cj3]|uniref:hypothetical protein n=1 Tax=Frankia sp. Cj3 TaxID=2880976 RepID=UPI001EF490D1|nr:hypothetical protein [Frankia sp. Cj3]